MTRKVLVGLVVLALGLPACNRNDDGPRRYVIDVDAKSSQTEKAQYSAFYPGEIEMAPGDSIRFRNQSTEAPHTVSFGVEADRSNQPPIITDTGENPVVLEACDIDDAPTAKLLKCDGKELKPFNGEGYWNSGFLMPQPAPKQAGDKAVTLQLADDIPVGGYTYVCILHSFMSGRITVVEEGEDRSLPADVKERTKTDVSAAKDALAELDEPDLERDGDTVTASAGWGDRTIAINRFTPTSIEVDTGTTVKWVAGSPYEPHTVTFDAPFEGTDDPRAFAPGGVESGSDYSGGFSTSGLFGAKGTPFEGEFSLRFTKAGSYEFTCILHPGMDGTVKVT